MEINNRSDNLGETLTDYIGGCIDEELIEVAKLFINSCKAETGECEFCNKLKEQITQLRKDVQEAKNN